MAELRPRQTQLGLNWSLNPMFWLWPLISDHKVDIDLWGMNLGYERDTPPNDGEPFCDVIINSIHK